MRNRKSSGYMKFKSKNKESRKYTELIVLS